MERTILRSMLANRSVYDLFEQIGNAEDFSPIGRAVLGAVSEYYRVDGSVGCCSRELIKARLLGRSPNEKHHQPLNEYIDSLEGSSSGANVEAHIRELHHRAVGGKLSLALANGAPKEEIQRLIQEYENGTGVVQGNVGVGSLLDIKDTSHLTSGESATKDYIKLWPKQLNERLDGGALKGHHVLVWARPEMGKTAFAINMCAGFLHQKLNVLYIANEEPAVSVRDRIWARLLKTTRGEIRANPTGAAERLGRADIGDLKIADEAPTFAAVRRLLRDFKADVLVLDQLRNMKMAADSKSAQLEAAATEARAIGKEGRLLVVSITQAGDSATGKVFIDMSDVDNSKTGIPGAVDLMIGVGADEAMKLNGLIGLSLPKNKLGGLHDKFTVSVNFQTGIIE